MEQLPVTWRGLSPKPIFIIGSPRSGTTILARSLAEHSHLWTSGEFHLLFRMFQMGWLEGEFEREAAFPGGFIQSEQITRKEYREAIGAAFNSLLTSRSGGKRWIEQTPNNTFMADMLAEMFPDALFLHILRDGRRVVNSMTNFSHLVQDGNYQVLVDTGFYPSWATDFVIACRTWRDSVDAAMNFAARHPNRCLTVKNEDLVQSPLEVFRTVLSFLGVPNEESPGRYFSSNRINSSLGTKQSPQALSQPWLKWSDQQKQIFIKYASQAMIKWGLCSGGEFEIPVMSDIQSDETALEQDSTNDDIGCDFGPSNLSVEGPVRQLRPPVGLWNDGWVGARLTLEFETVKPIRTLGITGFLPSTLRMCPTLTLVVSGTSDTASFTPENEFRWDVPLPQPAGTKLKIVVTSSATVQPKTVIASGDSRHLSFLLRRIVFHE